MVIATVLRLLFLPASKAKSKMLLAIVAGDLESYFKAEIRQEGKLEG
jgi:hypothetical protein